MNYIAIDVETTGLDRQQDQILEFAAVFATLGVNTPAITALQTFHTYVLHERYSGSAYAFNMNRVALERIAKLEDGWQYTKIQDLAKEFYEFIRTQVPKGMRPECDSQYRYKLIIAGKNYASFDAHFVDRIPGWDTWFKPHHRTLDLMNLFLKPGDKTPPGLEECLRRAGIDRTVKHTAAADAYDVIDLLRTCYPVDVTGEDYPLGYQGD